MKNKTKRLPASYFPSFREYPFYGKTSLSSDDETEELYKTLIRQGIVKEGEKNPEAY